MIVSKRKSFAVVVFFVALLMPLTRLKVADIQPDEVVLALVIVGVALAIWSRRGRVETPLALSRLAVHYVAFIVLASVLAALSLRLEFHLPAAAIADPLKLPPLLSLARLSQLSLCFAGFLFFATILSKDQGLLKFAIRAYIWVALLNAFFAIGSWIGWVYGGIPLPGAYMPSGAGDFIRARGFFDEGGEFGLYIVSALLMTRVRRYILKDMSSTIYWTSCAVLVAAIVSSSSKSGIVCLGAILTWRALAGFKMRYVLAVAVFASIAITTTTIVDSLIGYWTAYSRYSLLAQTHRDDAAVFAGRLAAVVVMPQVVVDHPFLGVGFGNYPLVRGDPKYGVPPAVDWDLPGIGIWSYAGDLGIPLLCYLLYIVWLPLSLVLRSRSPDSLAALAAFQLVAGMIVQITFFYPWFVTAVAVAVCLLNTKGQIVAEAPASFEAQICVT